jgi:translation initiation factor 1
MPGLFAGTPLERPITCARCERPLTECRCPRGISGKVLLPRDQPARVRREKRSGKTVTVIAGLDPAASDLPDLLKQLKSTLATGGTIGGGGAEIEVQGDHRERVVAFLKGLGYPAKPAGG